MSQGCLELLMTGFLKFFFQMSLVLDCNIALSKHCIKPEYKRKHCLMGFRYNVNRYRIMIILRLRSLYSCNVDTACKGGGSYWLPFAFVVNNLTCVGNFEICLPGKCWTLFSTYSPGSRVSIKYLGLHTPETALLMIFCSLRLYKDTNSGVILKAWLCP